ncbi:MAG: helix-turn-helix transcriptional regulator [Clostridia bacterium]|nr:helix-turn-helix transcriptional regulator [Clostridia bacterium]
MYISYANLWKTLIDKKISKTELMELTGMSSRTLAKLSHNQNVNTDTLLHICEVLGCGIDQILEVREGEAILSLYDAFHEHAVLTETDEFFHTYRLEHHGVSYVIKRTHQHANKHTVIHCEKDSILWEQLYPVGHLRIPERTVMTKRNFVAPGEQGIVLIDGSPMCITGLDENGFVSAKGKKTGKNDLYVMTFAAFKLFDRSV